MFYKTLLNFKLYDDRHILEYMNEYILQYKWLATKFAGQTFFFTMKPASPPLGSLKSSLWQKNVLARGGVVITRRRTPHYWVHRAPRIFSAVGYSVTDTGDLLTGRVSFVASKNRGSGWQKDG